MSRRRARTAEEEAIRREGALEVLTALFASSAIMSSSELQGALVDIAQDLGLPVTVRMHPLSEGEP